MIGLVKTYLIVSGLAIILAVPVLAGSADPSSRSTAGKSGFSTEEVIIDIDGSDDIRVGGRGEKHTLTSLLEYFNSRRPSRVLVRSKETTTGGLSGGMESFLGQLGFKKQLELAYEAIWVTPASAP
jgi:hypothetical protein